MSDRQEKLLLEQLLKRIESDSTSITKKRGFNLVLWIFTSLSILIILELIENGVLNEISVILISAAIGALVAMVSSIQNGETTWHYMKKHLSKSSITERLNEINT